MYWTSVPPRRFANNSSLFWTNILHFLLIFVPGSFAWSSFREGSSWTRFDLDSLPLIDEYLRERQCCDE